MQVRHADDALFFVAIADAGSLARAARTLGVAASTLSRRLSLLEQRLGVILVSRTTRALRLTEVGVAYLDRARAMVTALADAEAVATSIGRKPRGKLRVAAPPALGVVALGPILARYARRCPEVEVEVDVGERPVSLTSDHFDVALRMGLPATEPGDLVRRVGTSPRVLCASDAYLRRGAAPSSLAQLAHHPLIVLGSNAHQMPWTFVDASEVSPLTVSPKLLVNSSLLAREACIAGLGIALLPRFLIADDLETGRLSAIVLEAPPSDVTVHLLLAERSARSAKVREFVKLLDQLPTSVVSWTERTRAHPSLTK